MIIINKCSLLVATAAITLVLFFSFDATAQDDQGAVQAPPQQGSDAVDESEVINVVKDLIVQAEKCKVISESLGKGSDTGSCRDHYSRAMELLSKAVTDLQDNNDKTLNEHLKNAGTEFNACYEGIKDKDNSPLIPLTESLQKEVEECMGKLKVDLTGELTFWPGSFSMSLSHSHSGHASGKASGSAGASGSGRASASGGGSGSGSGSASGGGSGSGGASGGSGGASGSGSASGHAHASSSGSFSKSAHAHSSSSAGGSNSFEAGGGA